MANLEFGGEVFAVDFSDVDVMQAVETGIDALEELTKGEPPKGYASQVLRPVCLLLREKIAAVLFTDAEALFGGRLNWREISAAWIAILDAYFTETEETSREVQELYGTINKKARRSTAKGERRPV